jgi:DNA-binding transcriptional LysR family regulator
MQEGPHCRFNLRRRLGRQDIFSSGAINYAKSSCNQPEPLMDDLNSISIFAKIAEKMSFSLAAKELRLSPSAVSRHISELEERLGVTLLVRSTRKLSLTEAGQKFLDSSVQAIADLKAAMQNAAEAYDKPRGRLRINVTSGFGESILISLIHEFIAMHPDLRVELTVSNTPVNLIEAGLDVVIRSGRVLDNSLGFRELLPIEYRICAAPQFFAKYGKPKRVKDLEKYNCLTHSIYSAKEWRFSEGGRSVAVRVHGNFDTNSSEALRLAAINNLGITRIPEYVVHNDIEKGRLESVFDGMSRTRQGIRAFYPKTKKMPAKIAVFLDFLECRVKLAMAAAKPVGLAD